MGQYKDFKEIQDLDQKSVTVSIRKFGIIVLVSNRIEYYSIRFKISNIRTALEKTLRIQIIQIAETGCLQIWKNKIPRAFQVFQTL